MSRSLEAAIDRARARAVPWNALRAARVEENVARGRRRPHEGTALTRFALAGLAGAALCASLVHVSHALRQGSPPERGAALAPWVSAPDPEGHEAVFLERPVGDGGL